jgi:hypothetical protein
MKIKDILGEEDTIKTIQGDKAVVNISGEDKEVPTADILPGSTPGTASIKPPAPGELKPGMKLDMQSEEYEEGDEHPDTVKHYHDWMHSEHSPHSDEAGDDNAVFNKALHFLNGRVHPGDMEYHAHHMTNKFHGGMHEEHKDTIAQGGGAVGGDPTDNLIKDVQVKPHVKGTYESNTYGSKTELEHMLSIAGLR